MEWSKSSARPPAPRTLDRVSLAPRRELECGPTCRASSCWRERRVRPNVHRGVTWWTSRRPALPHSWHRQRSRSSAAILTPAQRRRLIFAQCRELPDDGMGRAPPLRSSSPVHAGPTLTHKIAAATASSLARSPPSTFAALGELGVARRIGDRSRLGHAGPQQ